VPADVYWDKAIINGGVVPCGDCEDGIEVAGEVTTPRDPDDRALSNDGVPGLAWYHTSTYAEWPSPGGVPAGWNCAISTSTRGGVAVGQRIGTAPVSTTASCSTSSSSMRSAPCHGRPSGPTTCGHGTPGSPPTPRPCARTRSRARGERPDPPWKTTPAKCAVVIVVSWLIVGIPLAYGCSTPSRQRCNSSADRPSRVSRPERRQPGLARHRHRHRHRVRKEVSPA